ncbi:MAG: PhzF family phenazine biosynthesis protein, partial [Arenicella sp.]|nr:PhzF family phenazine biosynthesis protein [Arenicella sp.]
FASGGVQEDPATGAAAAAFAGYLRDIGWSNNKKITIIQGEDMGCRSIITAEYGSELGSSIRVSGATRNLD